MIWVKGGNKVFLSGSGKLCTSCVHAWQDSMRQKYEEYAIYGIMV